MTQLLCESPSRLRRAFWALGMLLLWTLLNGAGAAAQAQGTPQYFRIKGAQVRSPANRGKRVSLERGKVLFPMTSGENRERYQPILLCKDLDLSFDEYGLSPPVDFEGFCYAANYIPATHAKPEEKLQWEVTKISRPDLAIGECEQTKQAGIREEQIRTPPQMNPESDSRRVYCRQSTVKLCFQEWAVEIKSISEKDVEDLIADRICSYGDWNRKGILERVGWFLECRTHRPARVKEH